MGVARALDRLRELRASDVCLPTQAIVGLSGTRGTKVTQPRVPLVTFLNFRIIGNADTNSLAATIWHEALHGFTGFPDRADNSGDYPFGLQRKLGCNIPDNLGTENITD